MQRLKKYTGIVQHIDGNDSMRSSPHHYLSLRTEFSTTRQFSIESVWCRSIHCAQKNVMAYSLYHQNMTLEGGLLENRVERFHLLVCGDIPFELSFDDDHLN